MTIPKRYLRVFLCHSSGDKPKVKSLYHRLVDEGIDVWLDKEKLLPGQNWQIEISKAVKISDVVIVCLSSGSINKEGFVQKEIRMALDAADEKPEGTIFIIPAKLENCEVPKRISEFQWVELFEDDGYDRLLRALRTRANSLGIVLGKFIGGHSDSLSAKGYKECINCGTIIWKNAVFCPQCGEHSDKVYSKQLEESYKGCINCGAWIPQNARYCSQCGMNPDAI